MNTIKKSAGDKGYGYAVISSHIKDHSNDPYVVKKAAKAKEMLNRVGLPEIKKK